MTFATRKPVASATLAAFAMLLALFAIPLSVFAHAELETASPADGAVLDAPPAEIVLTFTEALDAAKSHMELLGPDGVEVAKGGADPANETAMRIDPPALGPGAYQVRSTAVAAHDGAVARETLTFTITAPTPSPTQEPTATPTASPTATATASPSPSPSPSTGPASASGTDVLMPILAALVVVVLLGAMLLRGRSRGGGRA